MIGRLMRGLHLWRGTVGRVTVELFFEPRDLWVGLRWKATDGALSGERWAMVYVCLVPCLPVRFAWFLGFAGWVDGLAEWAEGRAPTTAG